MPLEAIAIGALSTGVNRETACCYAACAALLVGCLGAVVAWAPLPLHLRVHAGVGIALCVVLCASLAWIVHETGGLVSVEEQRRELNIDGDAAPAELRREVAELRREVAELRREVPDGKEKAD